MVQKPLLLAPSRNHRGRGLDIIHEQLAVQANLHTLAAYRHPNLKGFLIRNQLLVHAPESVERAGFLSFPIPAVSEGRVIDLDFETFLGKAGFLIGRMEVNARITLWFGNQIYGKFEVPEVGSPHWAGVKQMRTRSIGGQHAIDNLPGILVLARSPAIQAMPIE